MTAAAKIDLDQALLASSVHALSTATAIKRVQLLNSEEALNLAQTLESSLTGRSAVLDAIRHQRIEVRKLANGGASHASL